MCLIVFAWRAHEDFPLVLAANRDEFFDRASAPAAWWNDGSQRLAGRDLQAGGTWMGVSRSGRFAALTNYRDPSEQKQNAPSRGGLVANFLLGSAAPADDLAPLTAEAECYNGFNLLAGQFSRAAERDALLLFSSRDRAAVREVPAGIHGISNALLDTPWPKVEAAKAGLRSLLASTQSDAHRLTGHLLDLLDDRGIAPDDALPDTGLSIERERALSAIFIRAPGYGTRASTVLIVDRHGRVSFTERRCEPGQPDEVRRFEFDLVDDDR